jgi:hypothetical protein
VIKVVDFAPPGSLTTFLSSVYPLKSLTRELTSAAMFTKTELLFFFFFTTAGQRESGVIRVK